MGAASEWKSRNHFNIRSLFIDFTLGTLTHWSSGSRKFSNPTAALAASYVKTCRVGSYVLHITQIQNLLA